MIRAVTAIGTNQYGTGLTQLTLVAKNVTIKTSGSPADIAIVPVPSGVTRFRLIGTSALLDPALNIIANTFGGTQAAASFTVYDGAGGTGNNLTGATGGPTSGGAGIVVGAAVSGNNTFSSSSNLYIRQTADSANSGTDDFYIRIQPLN